ncbi:MAG: sugar phosphate isomerase/epimerase [Candidatus Acetothermia bacterium]|jgi:sugar phosphate isomerase/epimerase|nr:sugar phosphate isomerase/epimerase [Candidatus Acetothermia bacterium]MDH7504823.1 sugar phosphate isomerase/epimerase family protein [Candidatus Acetothermia bacterium]
MARRFKLGLGAVISLVGDDERQWEEQAALVRSEEAEFAEVWVEHWRGNRWLLEKKVGRLNRLLEGMEVILHAPFLWSSLITPTVAVRRYTLEELRATIELGAALGARGLTVHGGVFYAPYLRTEADGKAILAENLGELLPLAQGTGQFLAVENLPAWTGLPRSMVYPSQCADLLELASLAPGVRATLDIGHVLQSNEAPVENLPRLLPILANIHLHSCNAQGQAHQPLGAGVLELEALLQALLQGGYEGYLTLEVSDPTADHRLIRDSYRLLQRSVAGLEGRASLARAARH